MSRKYINNIRLSEKVDSKHYLWIDPSFINKMNKIYKTHIPFPVRWDHSNPAEEILCVLHSSVTHMEYFVFILIKL